VRPSYDRMPMRRFEFIPLGAIAVFLLHRPRRVDCPQHGVVVEPMPWSDGKSRSSAEPGLCDTARSALIDRRS